jgi:hypothetical protein
MNRIYQTEDDFEAVIRILRPEEGGRKSPPFNGIRWDLCYAGDRPQESLWMIWPDFTDGQGNSLPRDHPLPVDVELPARMTILNNEMRLKIHQQRAVVGAQFFCHEGPKVVAEGRITKITGLFHAR